jgi:hypothetical protein
MMQKNHDWVSVYTTCEDGKRHYVLFAEDLNYKKYSRPEETLELFKKHAEPMFFLHQEEQSSWSPEHILDYEYGNDWSSAPAWLGPRWYALDNMDRWSKSFAEHNTPQGSPTIELAMKPCPVCGTQWFNDNGDICYPNDRNRSSYLAWCNVSSWGCGYEVVGSSYENAVKAWNNASPSVSMLNPLDRIDVALSDKDVEIIQRYLNTLKAQRAWKIREMQVVNNTLSMLGLNFNDALKTIRLLMRSTPKEALTK